MDLSDSEKQLITHSFKLLQRTDAHLAEYFYECLFQMAPLIQPMFTSDRETLEKHFDELVCTAVSKVNHFESLQSDLYNLGEKHRGYGVNQAQFSIVKSALLLTVEYQLDNHCTPSVILAWGKYFDNIAAAMIQGLESQDSDATEK